MLGLGQVSPIVPPPPRGWPPARPFSVGLAGGRPYVTSIDPLALKQEALLESFRHSLRPTGSGLGQESSLGQLLAFDLRDQLRTPPHPRARELAWRRAHEQELRALAGQWVIVEGEDLIANGQDPVRLVADARGRGVRVPYIFFIEPAGENTVKLGL